MSARPDLTTEPTELELAQLSTAMRDAGITEHGMLIFRRAMFQLSRLRSERPAVTPEMVERLRQNMVPPLGRCCTDDECLRRRTALRQARIDREISPGRAEEILTAVLSVSSTEGKHG